MIKNAKHPKCSYAKDKTIDLGYIAHGKIAVQAKVRMLVLFDPINDLATVVQNYSASTCCPLSLRFWYSLLIHMSISRIVGHSMAHEFSSVFPALPQKVFCNINVPHQLIHFCQQTFIDNFACDVGKDAQKASVTSHANSCLGDFI